MSEPSGTANILHQHTEYNKLREDYSPEVANTLVQKNLARKNVDVKPEHVEGWYVINNAAASGQLDVQTERQVAETLAAAAGDAMLATAAGSAEANACMAGDDDAPDEDCDVASTSDEASELREDELLSLGDMYGYENDEDNDEAALDDVLKAQERAD
jgi:hypothetical protein